MTFFEWKEGNFFATPFRQESELSSSLQELILNGKKKFLEPSVQIKSFGFSTLIFLTEIHISIFECIDLICALKLLKRIFSE